jgi:hypothetical protein
VRMSRPSALALPVPPRFVVEPTPDLVPPSSSPGPPTRFRRVAEALTATARASGRDPQWREANQPLWDTGDSRLDRGEAVPKDTDTDGATADRWGVALLSESTGTKLGKFLTRGSPRAGGESQPPQTAGSPMKAASALLSFAGLQAIVERRGCDS